MVTAENREELKEINDISINDFSVGEKDMKNSKPEVMESETSHFGPWMLVRKSPRYKGKGYAAVKENKFDGLGGSRFASLNDNAEVGVENSTQASGHTEATAGKNNKEEGSIIVSKKLKLKSPRETSAETLNLSNKLDSVILHKMKTLQKQGITGLEGRFTQVTLPNPELVDYALLKRGMNTVLNPLTIPPDKDNSSKSQGGMEIDMVSSSHESLGMKEDVNHLVTADLDCQIKTLS
ncbi:hypothetical protein RIF29_31835 [Crotalaria pallida]|uniref:Uncharacterized protein n=1 Tax=Crotalaria pallida TaxID=3830 RepID=A0AAN9EMU7_CROPI